MIISFTTVFIAGVTTLVISVAIAIVALWLASRASRRALDAIDYADNASAQLESLAAALQRAEADLQLLRVAHDRTAATPTRPGLRQAVALSRHGASTEELVATCRIGQSEARLIQMLYPARTETESVASEIH